MKKIVIAGLALLLMWVIQGCFSGPKDPFVLTSKDAEQNNGPASIGYINDGYEWGFAKLGFMVNGHGMPDQYRAFVITHRSAKGQTELVWPVFSYGHDQANAEVLDHTLVFAATLPDRRPVLMAHRVGEPPMVISAAVLRLAAQRLGTSVIQPGTDYCFDKVRMPPERIWLKGQLVSAARSGSYQEAFTLELTSDDLGKVIEETRRRGKLNQVKNFAYLAEDGVPISITTTDVREIGAVAKPEPKQIAAAIHRITGYTPRNERLFGDAQLDLANQYAYFSTVHEPGRILKVALNGGSTNPPTVLGVAVLEGNEDKPFNSTIDVKNGYAYFGTDFPGHLVKVALGSSNGPPYRVSSVAIDKEWSVGRGVVDAGFGCFQVGHRLLKIRLGDGDAPPVVVSQMDFPTNAGVVSFASAVLDHKTRCAYFGCDIARIYKVALEEGDDPPKFIGSITLPSDEFGLRGALLDSENGFAYFTSQNGKLVKVALGLQDGPPTRLGALTFGPKYQYTGGTFGRDDEGYAYLESGGGGKAGDPECCVAGVLKVALGKSGELPRLVSFMPLPDGTSIEEGFLDPANRTLYLGVDAAGEGCKLLKLELGEGDAPPGILASTALYVKRPGQRGG